jgi:hypothetical protein
MDRTANAAAITLAVSLLSAIKVALRALRGFARDSPGSREDAKLGLEKVF